MIGLICPVQAELDPYLKELTCVETYEKAMLSFYTGSLSGHNITAVSCGVGRVNAAVAAQILIDRFEAEYIIVSGTAGAIKKGLKIGDTVIVKDAAYHDFAEKMLTDFHPHMKDVFMKSDAKLLKKFETAVYKYDNPQKIYYGRTVTGETFIEDEGRADLIKRFDPHCVDMETAGVAHVCYVNEIPFIAVRSISDTEDHAGVEAFRQNCALAAQNSFNVVKAVLGEYKKL